MNWAIGTRSSHSIRNRVLRVVPQLYIPSVSWMFPHSFHFFQSSYLWLWLVPLILRSTLTWSPLLLHLMIGDFTSIPFGAYNSQYTTSPSVIYYSGVDFMGVISNVMKVKYGFMISFSVFISISLLFFLFLSIFVLKYESRSEIKRENVSV